MAKQGQKLTDELKEQIRAELAANDNAREVARKFSVSDSTVRSIKKENPDEFSELRADKKQMMIDKIWESLVDAADLGHMMIKEAKSGKRDIPLSQISTYYGTLYDKRALMNNETTANTGITFKFAGELEEWNK